MFSHPKQAKTEGVPDSERGGFVFARQRLSHSEEHQATPTNNNNSNNNEQSVDAKNEKDTLS